MKLKPQKTHGHVAMGGGKTNAALETADVALMADDLNKLPYTINLNRILLLHLVLRSLRDEKQ